MKTNFFIALICMLFFMSCSEDSLLTEHNENGTEISNRNKGDGGDGGQGEFKKPFIDKDILVFDDVNHFTGFYTYLNSTYDQGEEIYDETVSELLGDFPSVKRKLDTDEFENPESRYQPFLTDPIMSTIVNEDFEVVIEDMYIVQMNNDEVLQMDISNEEGREFVKTLPKGKEVDIDVLPEGIYVGKDEDEEIFKRNILCGCSIDMELVSCNTIRISGRCRNFWKDTDGTISVTILNGLTSTFSVNGNYSIDIDVSGTPTNTVTLTVLADPDCWAGSNSTKTQTFTVGAYCDTSESDTGWGWKENSGQAISFRTATYKNFLFVYEEAKLYSYAWNPSGWRTNKAKLIVTIDVHRKNNVCGTIEFEDETKSCGNCRYKRARVNWYHGTFGDLVAYCTGDVVGEYFKEKSGIQVQTTAEPSYDCCM